MAAKRRGHNEGNIKQRADGLWEARVSLPGGKRKSYYGKTRREAQDKLRTALKGLDDGLNLSAGRQTVGQFLDQWLSASVKPSVKARTHEGYASIVRVRVAPRIGRLPLAKLSALDLQGLYAALGETGLSNRSIHHTHRCLHIAFGQAVRWNLIVRNPCDGVTPPRPERPELRVLSQTEARILLDATRDHRMHALYALAVTTGMRQGELLGLRWDDLDLDGGRLAVRRALQRRGSAGFVFTEPKTSRSRRTVMLGHLAIAALRDHRKRQLEERLFAGATWRDQGLVFTNRTGGPLDPSWQTATFKAALGKAGLPAVRFHDLRHTAATLLLSRGVHPKVVSEMLGHSGIALTLDTYSHLVPVMHAEAAAAMDDMLAAKVG